MNCASAPPSPRRNLEHLCRLLAEHLAKLELQAPVGELRLVAIEVIALDEKSASLLPDAAQAASRCNWCWNALPPGIGPDRVLRPVLTDDHRLEWMQMWQPLPKPTAAQGHRRRHNAAADLGAAATTEAGHARTTGRCTRACCTC